MINRILLFMLFALPIYGETFDELMETQKMIHAVKSEFYEAKESWESVRPDIQERYAAIKKAIEKRENYLKNLKDVNASLSEELETLKKNISENEVMNRHLDMLTSDILIRLQTYINSTAGYSHQERTESAALLMKLCADPEVKPEEKVRRITELLMVEADLARFAEAYEGKITLDGEDISGYTLRLGALGQFFTTQDKSVVAVYDPVSESYKEIDTAYADEIFKASRIIEKKGAPELIHLPIGRVSE